MKTTVLTLLLLPGFTLLTASQLAAQDPLTRYARAYPKQPSDSEREAALRPYQEPLDSLDTILESEEAQARDLADYPDPMPDSFVIWARDDRQVTPSQFVDILYKDMATYDSLNFEYRKFWVTYRRRTMLDPDALAMPSGIDYINAREQRHERMLSKLTAAIARRKH
ncbi:MAG: hypothetical protein Q8922_10120 [Bacteroidota bacterium]|nr:hypothetical protein [Bacteroidota bacterium]MDP4232410.1 hypothetical protein [Bacteroidota bacterium]MDP4241546.1 hypothetical protein [Bacteroidota bacterium]MDP4288280.1 hypothetical protein [Bacteroidota bacterium]